MIPLYLSIEGLYSYRQKQEINFRQLTDAQLFGIFGATGSGKSSILEAITFALYGQSARLNLRDNRGYNMMNLQSDRLHIDFHFQAGQEEYQFVASGRRSSKHFQTVRTIDRKAFRLENGQPIPIDMPSAEPILGLTYENFRRTIIIPQGKFQEFLQLSETDRSRMLKEIFHLQRFELAGKTKALQEKNQIKIAEKDALLSQLVGIHQEHIQELRSQIQLSEDSLAKKQKDLSQLELAQQKQEGLKLLFEKKEAQEQLVSELRHQEPSMNEKEQALKAYEACLISFKPLLDRQEEIDQALDKIKKTILQQRNDLQLQEDKLGNRERGFAEVEQAFYKRDRYLQKAEDLLAMIQLKKVLANTQSLNDRIQKGTELVSERKKGIETYRNQKNTIREERKSLQSNRPDMADLHAVQSWFTRKRELQLELKHFKEQLSQTETDKSQLNQEKNLLLKDTSLNVRQYDLPIGQIIELLEENIEQRTDKLKEAEEQLIQWQSKAALKNLQEQLKEGEACPLCGATDHPGSMDSPAYDFHLQKATEQIQSLKSLQSQSQQHLARLLAIKPQHESLKSRTEHHQEKLQTLESAIAKVQADFVWTQFNPNDEASLQLHIDQQRRYEAEMLHIDQALESLEKEQQDKEKELQLWQNKLQELQSQNANLQVEANSLQKGLKQLTFESYAEWSDLKLQAESDKARSDYESIERNYLDYQQKLKLLRDNTAKLKGELKALEKQQNETQQQVAKINQNIDQELAQSVFEDLNQVREILGQSWNLENSREEIRNFKQQLHNHQEKLAELNAEIQGKEFDREAFLELQEKIGASRSEIHDLQIAIGSQNNELTRAEADWVRKKNLQREKDLLTQRAENLQTLRRMFQASGFVNYVSTIYLRNLCKAANARFMRLTRGRLRLEKGLDHNQFEIIDQLNGGNRRSVKTLSGGQTFQAALCLALALADQVQQHAKEKQNFFFLDEGFGSQDKEALRIIFESLKALRKENRIVGIISHVEELQQEIGTYLLIKQDEEKGSQIKGSWE